jgi:hypothetical protein
LNVFRTAKALVLRVFVTQTSPIGHLESGKN